MTPDEWDEHWYRIREDHLDHGVPKPVAGQRADKETAEQFGPRPPEQL